MFISSSHSDYPGRNLASGLSHEAPASSNFIRPNWVIERDVKYGDGAEQLADLYLARNRKRNPAMIFIHGGGWISGDKAAYLGRAKKYALAGFNVIAINYTLARQDDETTRWPNRLLKKPAALGYLAPR